MANTFNHNDKVVITDGGNVGIGTTSPAAKLDINGDAIVRGRIYFDGTTSSYIDNISNGITLRSDNAFKVDTYSGGWQTRLTIVDAGNVGIGTTSPRYKLDVASGNSSNAFGLSLSGTERLKMYADGSSNYFEAKSGQNFRFTTTGGANFTILNNGNVGIGTTSPGAKLDVAGNIKTSSQLRIEKAPSNTVSAGPNIYFIGGTNASYSQIQQGVDKLDFWGFNSSAWDINMSIDNLNRRVGIGTTSPNHKLHVDGIVASSRASSTTALNGRFLVYWDNNNPTTRYLYGMDLGYNGTYRTRIFSPSEYDISLSSAPALSMGAQSDYTDHVVVKGATGNVGIGTTSPQSVLHISASKPTYTDSAVVFRGGTTNNNSHTGITLTSAGDALTGAVGSNYLVDGTSQSQSNTNRSTGYIRFANTTAASKTSTIDIGGFVKGTTTDVSRLFIDGDGNVGIGTTSPGEKLHVVGAIKTSRTTGATENIFIYNQQTAKWGSSTYPGVIESVGNNSLIIGSGQNVPLYLARSGAIALTIGTGGNVGIGTTSPGSTLSVNGTNTGSVPLLDLTASGSGAFQRGVRMLNTGMSAGDSIMMAVGNRDNSKNMGQFYFYYAGNASNSNRISMGLHSVDDVFNILGTGNVGIGTTSPGSKLEVLGNITLRQSLSNSETVYISTNARGGGTNDADLRLGNSNSGDILIVHNDTVGIGTTSPSYRLDVVGGAIAIRGNAPGNSLRFDDSGGTSRNAMYLDTSNYLNIGNSNYAGVKFAQTTTMTASVASVRDLTSLITNTTTDDVALGTPDAWLAVRIGTTDYAIPMYSV